MRKKDGRKLDFIIADRVKVLAVFEYKWGPLQSPNFSLVQDLASPKTPMVQLVANLDLEKTFPDGCEVRSAPEWLSKLDGSEFFLGGLERKKTES